MENTKFKIYLEPKNNVYKIEMHCSKISSYYYVHYDAHRLLSICGVYWQGSFCLSWEQNDCSSFFLTAEFFKRKPF